MAPPAPITYRAISLGLVAMVLVVYAQVVSFDFVLFDDHAYVSDNLVVKDGLSLAGIGWAFTTFHISNWHPLTWLSHLLDVEIWGLHPGGHHFTSILLHALNAVLLFFIFRKMTGREWAAAIVAALFALHPLHIESVAWIAERKDVLSTLFFLLALNAYIHYTQKPTRWNYLPVAGLFACGLMAKPMLVTFPFVLLLMDYWPLRRFTLETSGQKPNARGIHRPALGLLTEKIPLFVLSAVSCVITFIAQDVGGSVAALDTITLSARVANALISYLTYLLKMIWPAGLSVYYPFPEVIPYGPVLVSIVTLVSLSLLALYWVRAKPWFMVGWCWYLGTLVPVIGVVQVGTQAMADRYTYIPAIGIFIIAAWAGRELFTRLNLPKTGVIIAGGLLVILALVSHAQVGVWKNSTTLYEQAIQADKNNHEAYYCLGMATEATKNYHRAYNAYLTAIRLKPDFADAYVNLGALQATMGDYKAAETNFHKGLQFEPHNAKAHSNLGKLAARKGRLNEAIRHFNLSLQWDPHKGNTYANLGLMYLRIGKIHAAVETFNNALEVRPADANVQLNLERTLAIQGEINRHTAKLANALRSAMAGGGCRGYPAIRAGVRDTEAALAAYQKALSVLPGYSREHLKLENMPAVDKTVRQAQEALRGMKRCPAGEVNQGKG